MHSITCSFDQKDHHEENQGLSIRQDFIDNLTAHRYRFFLSETDIVITELFTSIYDLHHGDEKEFTNSVLFTIFELLPDNIEAHKIGQQALDFYEEHKSILATKADTIGQQALDIITTHEVLYRDAFDQLQIAASCYVNFEPLSTAVTLSCGHSLNENSAESIYGKLDELGRCVTNKSCFCNSIPTHYFASPIIREAAAKIEEISKTLPPDQDFVCLTINQTKLIQELLNTLQCSYTLKPFFSAIILFENHHDNSLTRSNDLGQNNTCFTPDYTLRELANLAQKISSISINSSTH